EFASMILVSFFSLIILYFNCYSTVGIMEKLLSDFEYQSFEDWLNEAQSTLGDKPIDKLYSLTYEGIKIKPIYTRKDFENLKYLLGEFPGLPNYVRGAKVSGYKTNPWKIAQSYIAENADTYNHLLKKGIEIGLNTIILEIFKNKPGFECNFFRTLNSFANGFKDINIEKFEVFIRSDCFPQSVFYFKEVINRLNFNNKTLYGGFEFNPYNLFFLEGKLPPKDKVNDIVSNFFDWAYINFPNFYSICIDASCFKESGGSAVHEIAFAISSFVEFLKLFAQQNYDLEKVFKKFYFKFSFGGDFSTDLAKIRAFRLLLSMILSQFSLEFPNFRPIIFAVTTQRNKSFLDHYTNILRSATETLSAILSGVDYIETIPFGAPLRKFDDFGYRNSQNIQNVLYEEHNFLDTIDPIGGSWFIESLAFELAKLSLELSKELENISGFYEAVKNGLVQSKINENLRKRLINLSNRKEILVGVNKYPQPTKYAEKIPRRNKVGESASNVNDNTSLLQINEHEIFQKENEIIEFARKGGDLFAVRMFETYDYYTIIPLKEIREAETFEELYEKSNKFEDKFGHRPQAMLLNYGNIDDYKFRSDFAQDFLGVGGIETIPSNPSFQIEDLAKSFFDSNCEIAVICSSDKLYPQFVPQISALIKKKKPLSIIILAGKAVSQDLENFYKTAGVDVFINQSSNIFEELEKIYNLLTF
ncbi:MAG: methylmalonyl-CoA mutase family protein, partial [Candidatus Kapaibacteriales bacterium]